MKFNKKQKNYCITKKSFFEALFTIEDEVSHQELLLCIENKNDTEFGKKIRTQIEAHLNNHARKIVEDA